MGDFDGNGKLDLAITGEYYQVTIYPGIGDGTFAPPHVIATPGFTLQHIQAADLNGDGKLDLVLQIVSNAGEFGVMLGNGDGTFRAIVAYSNGGGAFQPSLVVGDVNNDHVPDVIMGGAATIGVSLGKGDGTFQAPLSFPATLYIEALAIADINGDGKADVIAADNRGGYPNAYATALLGSGDGTFAAPVDIPVDGAPNSIAVADFNRDGKLDLLTANTVSNDVSVLLNTGLIECLYTVAFPFNAPLPQTGGGGLATVTTPSNCSWTATSSDPSWLEANAEESQGSGGVLITADQNLSPAQRSATVTIADQTFNVTEAADPCGAIISNSLFPPGAGIVTIGGGGTSMSFALAIAPSCTWTSYAIEPFITLSTTGGSGSATITVTFAANASPYQQYGNFYIANQSFQVFELGNGQDFADVLPSDYYFAAVNLMQGKNITSGCAANPPLYCPTENVTRAQMAIFLVRTILGTDTFPFNPEPYFTDVPTGSFGFQWIQKLKDLGITSGCAAGVFCPDDPVSRDQMAVFIIRARYGATTVFDYPATPYFTDVPATEFAFPWIQRMKEDGITSGCSATLYCPSNPVTRGDMAIFIMRGGFNQLLPPLEPVITQISPSTVPANQSASITVSGLSTNFVEGSTIVNPILGFALGAVSVISPTELTVQVTAGANPTPQPESLLVITGAEEAVLPNALNIQ